MKKLSLKNLKLESNDLLQREHLKGIFGGYDGGYGDDPKCMSDDGCNTGCSENKLKDGVIKRVCTYCCIA